MFATSIRSAARNLILFYTTKIPYHRGKWRIVEILLQLSGAGKLDRGKSFVVQRGGIQWRLATDCSVQRRLFYHGGFDHNDIRELTARLERESVFFDIGSYFGYYSLTVARQIGGRVRVFAFEPVPANHRLLAENCARNGFGNIEVHQLAVSNSEGTISFEVPPDENGGVGRISTNTERGKDAITVNATTLDHFVEEHGINRLDAMKIDVEGAEVRVLEGGRTAIQKFRPVMIVELNPPCLRRFGSDEAELVQSIRSLGYGIYRATASGLELFDRLKKDEAYMNIFCVPN